MKARKVILFLIMFGVVFPVSNSFAGVDENSVVVSDKDESAIDDFFSNEENFESVSDVEIEEEVLKINSDEVPVENVVIEEFVGECSEEEVKAKEASMEYALKRMDQLEEELDELSSGDVKEPTEDADVLTISKDSAEVVDVSGGVQKYDGVVKKYKPVFSVSREYSLSINSSLSGDFEQKLKDLQVVLEAYKNDKNSVSLSEKDLKLKEVLDSINGSYENLLDLSSGCCSSYIANEFRKNDVSYNDRYKFMLNDVKSEEVQEFCMFYGTKDIYRLLRSSFEEKILMSAKNDCICKNKKYISSEIKVFEKLFEIMGKNDLEIIYKYNNVLGRRYDINMINHIKNLEKSLKACY